MKRDYFSEVRNNYCHENFVYIDAWKTDDDNEEGHTVAYVHRSGDYVITDPDANNSAMVAEAIEEAKLKLNNGYYD